MSEDEDCFGEYEEDCEDCQNCDEIEACKEKTTHLENIDRSFDIYAFLFGAGILYIWKQDLLLSLGAGMGFAVGFGKIGKESPFKNIAKAGVILLILINVIGFIWGSYEASKPAGESNIVGFFFVDENDNELSGIVYIDNEEEGRKTVDGGIFLLRSEFEDGHIHLLRFEPEGSNEYCEYEISKEVLTENAFYVEC